MHKSANHGETWAEKKGGPKTAVNWKITLHVSLAATSERDPDSAFVITPPVVIIAEVMGIVPMLVEIPVVGMCAESHAGHDRSPPVGMPAIAFGVANHASGGRRSGKRHSAHRHQRRNRGG